MNQEKDSDRTLMSKQGEGRPPNRPSPWCSLLLLEVQPLRLAGSGLRIETGNGEEGESRENLWALGGGVAWLPRKTNLTLFSSLASQSSILCPPLIPPFYSPSVSPSPILLSSTLRRDRSIELNPLNFIGHGRMTFR